MKKILFLLVAIIPLAAGYLSGLFSLPDLVPEKSTGNTPPANHQYRSRSPQPVHDLTSQIERLGNPFADSYPDGDAVYARNVWDLQLFAGKIFIGGGNSSNTGPATNAGPVGIKNFDLLSEKFSEEGTVDEEQIDTFRVLDQRLYIPGHDPTQSWKFGNFYRRNNDGTWTKYRTIPGGLHTYDMARSNGVLFAAIGKEGGGAILQSTDEGQSWKVIHEANNRIYTFFEVGNTLFGASKFAAANSESRGSISIKFAEATENILNLLNVNDTLIDAIRNSLGNFSKRNGGEYGLAEIKDHSGAVPRFDIGAAEIFPETAFIPNKYAKIIKPLAVEDKVVYIGAYTHNDHQYMPFGLYVTSSLRPHEIKTNRIHLPESALPRDVILAEGYVFVLVSVDKGETGTLIQVLRAPQTNLNDLQEMFRFTYASFARSFELADGDFYFGIGSEVNNPKKFRTEEISPSSGDILRLSKQSIRKDDPRLQ